jgi:hypothetical protein
MGNAQDLEIPLRERNAPLLDTRQPWRPTFMGSESLVRSSNNRDEFMRIERKALRCVWLFVGPALLLLVYVPFATRGNGRSNLEMWTAFSLVILPGSYVIATLGRPWWARVILVCGYMLFVFLYQTRGSVPIDVDLARSRRKQAI